MRNKTLLIITAVALTTALPLSSPGTGIPVIDFSNLLQNIVTALHQVLAYSQQLEQYAKQIQQYQLQLQQYANQVKNTIAPVAQIYQSATGAINSVMGVAKVFQSGSQLQATLSQFQNVNYWLSSPQGAYTYQTTGSANQTQANAAMINGIVAQSQKIQQDAATLQSLQNQAQSADGQMKALSAANQLAALEQEQLLQIRALLVQEQGSLAARSTTTANDAAMRQANTQTFYGTQIAAQPHTGYAP